MPRSSPGSHWIETVLHQSTGREKVLEWLSVEGREARQPMERSIPTLPPILPTIPAASESVSQSVSVYS
jgi:hypothetical protein